MKVSGLIVILFLLGLTIVVALGVAGVHSQRDNGRLLERVVADLTDRSRQLEGEVRELQMANARLEAAAAVVAPPVTNIPPAKPQAFQARAFVGSEYVGMAWVIPRSQTTVNGSAKRAGNC